MTHRFETVLEETGYNLAGQINVNHVIELSIREQTIALYIVPGVPEDYPFKTKTRKEISVRPYICLRLPINSHNDSTQKIEWFKLSDLPTWKRNKPTPGKFYLISPFIG
jgi:mRNA-decapping enzyme subunit 2